MIIKIILVLLKLEH